MPDVSRSDSQRSDTSLKPRVSFNRDVHVKRIVPSGRESGLGVVPAEGVGGGPGVRRERPARSRRQLAVEAAHVLHQADTVGCTTKQHGVVPDKFYTLPTRRKHKRNGSESPHSSQERVNLVRRRSEELGVTSSPPPKKPPRTFASNKPPPKPKASIFNIFKKSEKEIEPKKSNLRRSVSDASNLKSKNLEKPTEKPLRKRSGSESEDGLNNPKAKKSQLSPIIEVSTPREDYFTLKRDYFSDKENVNILDNKNDATKTRKKWQKPTEDEVDGLLNERNENNNKLSPEVVIIDVDSAENISKKKKPNSQSLKNKLKSLTSKREPKLKKDSKPTKKESKENQNNNYIQKEKKLDSPKIDPKLSEGNKSPIIQQAIKSLEKSSEKSPEMKHSSQQPVEKLPLTRGHTVDTMIRRLNRDKSSPPPKTNLLVTPTVTVAHNNNQPFSYTQPTRAISPERSFSRSKSPSFEKPSSPVIYAQVVCGNGDPEIPGSKKQTIHTVYTNGKKHLPHSDSDEGLGYEENSFGRKYDHDKSFTHFGDTSLSNEKREFYKDVDKFDEEFPITPKFKTVGGFSNGFGGYNEYSKTEQSVFIDSSARGRGDGMDSRRRESLTEPHMENGFKQNGSTNNLNGRSDLSYRRDLLESRLKSRRLGEKQSTLTRNSPEFSPKPNSPTVNKYVSETTSRYYRHGSTSPVGFTEKYTSETKVDRNGEKYTTESRSRSKIGDYPDRKHYLEAQNGYDRYDRYDGEPKSLDSQASDYRSSPENINSRKTYFASHEGSKTLYSNRYKKEKMSKDRDHYKSNPEIHHRNNDSYKYDDRGRFVSETYHDSLRRQKHDLRNGDSPKRSEKYFDDTERKDKFGDSGIENDFRRDSGENVRIIRHYRSNNESEDEGFASSLLIASERQHTDDNFGTARKHRREYDSDKEIRGYGHKEEEYIRHDPGYKRTKHEYVHRERSIDDGSHYDPRIDKDMDGTLDKKGTLKKMDKKPPKPAKKSSLEKVKQLFTRDSSKKFKKEKEEARMVREDSLRARYREYRGSSEALERNSNRRENHSDNSQINEYSNRRRLSTPSPSPTRENGNGTLRPEKSQNGQSTLRSEKTHGSWFKSLDRLSRKKSKPERVEKEVIKEVEAPKPQPTKNLRFFGDTDIESGDSIRQKSSLKSRPSLQSSKTSSTRTRSQSTRDLHNISEEFDHSDVDLRKNGSHKSMHNISESDRDIKGSRVSLKPPASPNRSHSSHTLKSRDESRNRRRRNEVSSVESSTEGDSSQQSQRSVVYLHAATVGDIPGPGFLSRNGRRAASREELASNGSSRVTQVKTLSRSFSVLAPWKPKHAHEALDIDYSQQPSRPVRNGKIISKSGGKTAKEISNQKKLSDSRKSSQNLSTLSRKSKSKENVSHTLNRRSNNELTKGSSTTLYKKKERQPKENLRYSRDDKKIASKSMSVESLGGGRSSRNRDDNKVISRSISMPRDPEKSAGWFKMSKKNNKKTVSSQRL